MDEKQLQFLYNEYAKNKGFKDYSEFKGLMSFEGSRKLFFDDANTELGFKDYNEFNDLLKKKDGGQISSPIELPSVSPDFEKGKAFAEKGFLMQAEGTKAPKKQKISIEPSLSLLGVPKVEVLEEGEDPSLLASLSSAGIKGQIQGKVANILSAGRKPAPEELGEIAQLQSDINLFPQSKAERTYQEKGLAGVFKNPALGLEFIAETIISSASALVESSKKTVPAGVVMGAAAGAPFAGIGALPGALTGIAAGQIAAGYNLSTSSKILEVLSKEGVDITNKESLINAFSDDNKMSKIRTTAAKYGVPIAIVDAFTGGIAGKFAAGAVGKSLSKRLVAGFGEAGIQVAGGASGDLAGQLASGQKVNWDDVIIEGIAAVPGGVTEVVSGVSMERANASSNNKTLATQIATQGVEDGSKDAFINLNRDLQNKVITPEQYQEGINFVEKALQVSDKIPETVIGESRVESIELLVERNDLKQANENLLQQKQTTDEAYHAGIDEEIKANEERIKKIDSEVYNTAKKPTDQQQFKESKEGNLVTFTYSSEAEVPEVFKDRISSTGENTLPDGTVENFVRVTVPKSLADYELAKAEVKPTEVKEDVKVEEVKKSKLEAYKEKYAQKQKIEPIKIEDNGNPIIAKDPAENDIAIAKLAKQDNPVEESSIKAIEGKAEGDIKAKLNEVIAEVDDKIKLATRIEMVAMNDLKTDEASFQNREGLNLKKVDDIVANYNPSEFDPIIYWTDASGQKYTLNHHRFAAAQKLKLDEIPAQKLTYPLGHPKEFQVVPATDKAEAIDFAINRSNANRSMETAVERAKALRKLQKTGTKEDVNKFLEREGKNKTKIQNIAALNENGKTIDALKMFGDAEDIQLQKETEQRSDWIGEARRRISGLTNEHENEMFDFLMDKDASKRITSKADFISKVTSLAGGFDFNPENPLNLKRFKYQTEGERAYDEVTGQLKSEIDTRQTKIDDLKARFSDPSRRDYIATNSRDYEQTKKIADDQISKLNTEIKSFQQKLQDHYKEKGKYQGGIEQGGLFATEQATTEDIDDMANIVKDFYDDGMVKLDDIKREVAKELGFNNKSLEDVVERAYNKMVMEYTPVEISKGVIGKVGEKLNELGEDGVVMLEDDQSIFAKAAQLEQEGGKIDYDLKEAKDGNLINIINSFFSYIGRDYKEGYMTPNEKRSAAQKSNYGGKRLTKILGFDIGNLKPENKLTREALYKISDLVGEGRNAEYETVDELLLAYNKAKTDDSNPELVKTVESVLGFTYGKENLAPNGKKSNLTPEQYVLVRTPNFKKWFGDWENDPENASKVIDENGEPLVVYHGSIAPDIEVFDRELSKRKPSGLREMGFYFTTNKELAEFYSTAPAKEGAKNIKSKVYQSFLNLKTVKEFDAKGKNGLRAWDQLQVDAGYKIAQNRDAMDFLQNGKFGVDKVDGIIARNISDMESYGAVGVNEKFNGTVFLVFDDNKNSIKSATDNTGAFSTTDDRINYMAKPSGDILGFTYGKTIYLNASKINPNTPIHEGGHIWTKWVKNNDPRLYDRGMELVKNSKYLERAKSSKFYQEQAAKLPQGEREAYFQEEALAMAIGDKGAQFVAEAKKSSFKEWLDNLWDAIKNAAGFDNITAKELQNLTFDEFVKRAARDILSPKSQQELASINEGMAEAYKDLTINQKRQIINSKFDELLRVLKIEKICP